MDVIWLPRQNPVKDCLEELQYDLATTKNGSRQYIAVVIEVIEPLGPNATLVSVG